MQKDLLKKEVTTHYSFLPGEFHGLRSLVGYILSGCKDSDMTKQHTHNYLGALLNCIMRTVILRGHQLNHGRKEMKIISDLEKEFLSFSEPSRVCMWAVP